MPPPGRVGAVGMGNGPAILSKFMVSSFKMSVFDKARLYSRVTKHRTRQQDTNAAVGKRYTGMIHVLLTGCRLCQM